MTEFELKFEVLPANFKNVEAAVLAGSTTQQRLQARYFDTAEGALAARGIVVRLRKEGRRWVQTAKGPTADLLERLEHNADAPLKPLNNRSANNLLASNNLTPDLLARGTPAQAVPELDLSRHRGTPIGKLMDKALSLRGEPAYPKLDFLYGTDVQRITRRVAQGGSLIELALDQGRVFTDGHTQPISELEFELLEGTPGDAITLARQWAAVHGLWMSTVAKSMKGQRLKSGVTVAPAAHAVAPKFSRHASGPQMLASVVTACLQQILPNMSELANCSGSEQPEHIHQLRVGIRRLRTALRELGSLTTAVDPAWEPALVQALVQALEQAFRALGAHRDKRYLAEVLLPQLLNAGGPALGFDHAVSSMPNPGEAVRAADFQDALLGLLGLTYLTHRHRQAGTCKPGELKKAVLLRLKSLHSRALRDGKRFLELDETQQHSVRKRFKRLRYLIEFTSPLFASRRAGQINQMLAALKPVQDALGLYNDELMALHAMRDLATSNPNAWFGVGWLSARRKRNAVLCLKSIKALAGVQPFWRR